eukprot:GHVS01075640.1.p1 GENE.GHVS01075640.1~~GHVS01075640.1.p1  ORF type:complete len:894 (-),score=145.23 GHVS01075640.1:1631-4312(-)
MGNQLLKTYSVEKDSELEGGRFLRWKLLQAVHKDRQHQPVTLFVFDKKLLDRYERTSVRDALLESLRRDATKLQKLRHPNLLHILEPLSEERSSLAFATKPVLASLYQYTQLAYNAARCLSGEPIIVRERHKGSFRRPVGGGGMLSDDEDGRSSTGVGSLGSSSSNLWAPMCLLEKKCGLLDIAEAIAFLHQDAKLVHRNINPHSVFITTQGKWLLGGMSYSVPMADTPVECDFTFSSSGSSVHDVGGVSLDPPLMYAAPEMTRTFPGRCTAASDMYSLGLLIYELLSEGNKLLINVAHYDVQAHYAQCRNALPFPAHTMPTGLHSSLTDVLSVDPERRPSIQTFLQSPFFQDINVRALRFLETLREKDEAQNIQFLQGLTRLLEDNEDFDDTRLLRERVLTPLVDVLPYSNLYPHVLPNLFLVLKKVTNPKHFQEAVWPSFRPLLTAKEIQIESVLMIIRELDFILTLCTDEMTNNHVLPLVLKCLEIPQPHIQEVVLAKLTILSKRFDYSILKNSVLPRVLNLLLNAASSHVRVSGLQAVTLVSASFDRPTILEQIIPVVEKIYKVDRAAVVCLGVAQSLETLARHLGNKLAAERILPIVVPLLVEENLNAEQFTKILGVVKNIIKKIEESKSKGFQIVTNNSSAVTEALGSNQDAASFETLLLSSQGLRTSNAPQPLPPQPISAPTVPPGQLTAANPPKFSTTGASADPFAVLLSSSSSSPPPPPTIPASSGVGLSTSLSKLLVNLPTGSAGEALPPPARRAVTPSISGLPGVIGRGSVPLVAASITGPSWGGESKTDGLQSSSATTGSCSVDLMSLSLSANNPSAVHLPRSSADPFAGLSTTTGSFTSPPAKLPPPPPPAGNMSGLFSAPPTKPPRTTGDPWGGLDILK